MQLDTTTKIVGLISTIVGVMISVAGYYTNLKLQSLETRLKTLDEVDKGMDISKKEYDLSPRLTTEFLIPLARSFAAEYNDELKRTGTNSRIAIPMSALSEELQVTMPNWANRKGLMTGNACESEGLKARQIITLVIKNIGQTDASDITIKALYKSSPHKSPAQSWQEMSNNKAIPYYDLRSSNDGWKSITFPVSDLRGQSSPESSRNEAQIVLASVSGAATLFGTIIVPIEISWKNRITNKQESQSIFKSELSHLRFSLLGAEIGTACN